jgi:hypothetical protein
MRFLRGFVAVGVAGCTTFGVASSEPLDAGDDIGLGDGRDGNPPVSSSQTVNRYYVVRQSVEKGDTRIAVDTVEGLAAEDVVLVWQVSGMRRRPPSGDSVTLTDDDGAGTYELRRVASVEPNLVVLKSPLGNGYSPPTQLVRVPQYKTLTVNAGASIRPADWNGKSGGIVAFLVQERLVMDGNIEADASGYRPGLAKVVSVRQGCIVGDGTPSDGYASKGTGIASEGAPEGGPPNVANAGGGGACTNGGGGGGGHGGKGGRGGNSWDRDNSREVGGLGGAAVVYDPEKRLVMGGGGGAGEMDDGRLASGGAGGGVVLVRASQIVGNGWFGANGAKGGSNNESGAGGGGAGGLVFVTTASQTLQCKLASATGGAGGDVEVKKPSGPGGGGGGGLVRLVAAGSKPSAACPSEANPGLSGLVDRTQPWGATNGALGKVE